MLREPLLRAGAYLFIFLLGMATGSFFPHPYAEAVCLLSVCIILLLEWLCYSEDRQMPLRLVPSKKGLPALLLFPVFFGATLGINLLSSQLFPLSRDALDPILPTPALFIGAVLLAPVTEEILFRGILLRMLGKYGEGRAILLSAIVFALAHANFFQMPYALVAGLLLSLVASVGGSLLYPYFFHLAYNLCTFFSGSLPLFTLLLISGALAIIAIIALMLIRPRRHPQRRERFAWKHTWLLLFYAAETVYMAARQLL